MILDYIVKFHFQDLISILANKDDLGYYNLKIDFLKLFESYPDVGDKVLCSPVESLPACNRDIIKAQQNLIEFDEYKEIITKLDYCSLKRNVHARFFGLPVCPELHRTVFPKNVDLRCFLKVTGTVVRVTQTKMLEYQRKYVCIKCKFENCVEAEFENRYILKAPTKCGNDNPKCKSSTFTQVNLVSREYCKDYQEIKIQEQVNKLSIGTIPGSLWVVLENDLVDCCKPGDDVIICGTVRRRWRPCTQTKKSEVELVLQANYIEVCNAQRSEVVTSAPDVKECYDEYWTKYEECPIKGRDQILMAVCPQVYGLQLVKLAVLLTVITGSNHVVDEDKKPAQDENHTARVRGQCHLLLVGDPDEVKLGDLHLNCKMHLNYLNIKLTLDIHHVLPQLKSTGKSQLLRAGVDLTARSVFTSGAGSTRAGLTCAALREEGEWQLEAGALVLSDGGVCCIDEISQLREHDRTAIHEAMEQQTISIAKAGIVCKLNTRCSIIAACNPKGHYQTDQPLSVNVSLGTPLLSRFDLIFILLDSKNKAWDKLVSSYILFGGVNTTQSKKSWNIEKLQMYISLVGPRYTKMTKTANIILQSYYMMQRKSEHRDPSRTTVRMLDSLVRLSQAHCRLMYRTTILPMDAIIAVSLVDLSMQDCTLDDTVDALHSTFQKYPDFDYLCLAKKLLTRLNLYEIWQNELLYYGKLLQVDHKTLQHDLENGNPKLFAKFDDVTDDSIALPASLVTSSYFNKAQQDKDLRFLGDRENDKNDENNTKAVNNLAATLKKHANLNKDLKKLPVVQKKIPNKRKRKEVTVDTSAVKTKITKVKKMKKNDSEQESDCDIFEDEKEILKAVPSVNDVFADLGIDFNFGSGDHVGNDNQEKCSSRNYTNSTEINENHDKIIESVKEENFNNSNNSCNEMRDKRDVNIEEKSTDSKANCTENPGTSKTMSKLKQFSFNKSHDFEKYVEKPFLEESPVKPIHKLDNARVNSCNTSNERLPAHSSQISMFESSDCDIDLDI